MTTSKCWICNGKMEEGGNVLFLHRYAHISCAERSYLMTDEGIHGIEEWRQRPSGERFIELSSATGRKYV